MNAQVLHRCLNCIPCARFHQENGEAALTRQAELLLEGCAGSTMVMGRPESDGAAAYRPNF